MRTVYLLCLAALFMVSPGSLLFAEDKNVEEVRYVEVRRPFPNVYEKLDPKSNVLNQPRKGEFLELVTEGTSWYRVRIRDRDGELKEGYLERRAGTVVRRKGIFSSTANIVSFILNIVLILGLIAGVYFYFQREKAAVS